jgi:hypothetical protein
MIQLITGNSCRKLFSNFDLKKLAELEKSGKLDAGSVSVEPRV